ncbi:MAG: hypothetical protein LBJ67_02765 [Planctomycetaceae bacterium]|jgi:flagellar motor component MotA|nr:hypothetical protein [Planctomycetaceae bacterium]
MLLLIDLTFIVITLFVVIIGGGTASLCIDCPGFFAMILSLLLFVIGSGKWSVFWRGLKYLFAFRRNSTTDVRQALEIFRFFRTLSIVSVLFGGFWSISGLLVILSNLNPQIIGSALAVAILTTFYSLALSLMVFLPISVHFGSISRKNYND